MDIVTGVVIDSRCSVNSHSGQQNVLLVSAIAARRVGQSGQVPVLPPCGDGGSRKRAYGKGSIILSTLGGQVRTIFAYAALLLPLGARPGTDLHHAVHRSIDECACLPGTAIG